LIREEGDRLIKIIRSRVVDSPANDDRITRPRDISNTTLATGNSLYSKHNFNCILLPDHGFSIISWIQAHLNYVVLLLWRQRNGC